MRDGVIAKQVPIAEAPVLRLPHPGRSRCKNPEPIRCRTGAGMG